MRRINRFTPAVAALLIATLACYMPSAQQTTQDPNAPLTAAAQTVAAQLTASAPLLNSPTVSVSIPTASPTNTVPASTIAPPATFTLPATATQECDRGQFIADVNIPDGTIMTPGQAFTKTWRLKNIGTCSWTGYSLVFDDGNSMSGLASSTIGTTPPGGTVDVSVNLVAPATAGNYRGYWRIKNSSGVLIPITGGYQNKSFYVDIKVQTVSFAVTSITYTLSTWSDAGHINCPRVVAHITVNAAGTVTFKWTRADNPGGGASQTVTFAAAGTKNVNNDWARGSVWAGTPTWVGIYVIDPNNQDFGHKNFNTACTSP